MSNTTFQNMNLSKPLMQALDKMAFSAPSPVQRKAIGPMLRRHDLIVQAPTGTGKTAAFGIPLVQEVDQNSPKIQAVVVCPTRELALQITGVLKGLACFKKNLRVTEIYGGLAIERQEQELRRRPQIIVATPGRLLDHLQRGSCDLSAVKTVVLDEADRMLDMGFRRDIDRIFGYLPKQRQTVMFSATMTKDIMSVAQKYQKDVQTIRVGEDRPVDTVKQFYLNTEDKTPELFRLLRNKDFAVSLVFVATKRRADRVARQLNKNGFQAGAIHGDLNQNQRERVMSRYRGGQIDILVATDVAARGIDVHNIDAVINYDIPNEAENYTHRIGRSGRAGASGVAYTFVRGEDREKLGEIIKVTRANIVRCDSF